MKDWEPPYIQTKVKPVTVLQSNEGVKMKRFEPAISDEMIPYFKEVESGRVVYHYNVQKMLDNIITSGAIFKYSPEWYAIKDTIKCHGFEVKE